MSLQLTVLYEKGGEISGRCKVKVIEKSPFSELEIGEPAKFDISLTSFPAPKNPGEKDFRFYQWLKGFALTGRIIRNYERYEPKESYEPDFFERLLLRINALRWKHKKYIEERFPAERARLLSTLLIGAGSELPDEMREEFQAAGVAHILAISGLHLGLVIAGIFYCLRLLLIILIKRRQDDFATRIGAAVSLLFVVLYTLYAGASPSAVRAAIIYTVILVGLVLRKQAITINSLGIAALISLIVNPLYLFTASFQLSYSAFLGILLSYHYILPELKNKAPLLNLKKFILPRALNYVFTLVVSSAVITILTIPLTLYHFYFVSFGGIVSNILVMPLLSYFVLPFLVAGAFFLSVDSHPVAQWLFQAASFYASGIEAIASAASKIPLIFHYPAFPERAVLYFLFFYLCSKPLFTHRIATRPKMLAFVIIPLSIITSSWDIQPLFASSRELKAHFLAVGLGDSAVIELPDGKVMLIDAPGNSFSENRGAGKNIVAPFLLHKGHNKIDYMVLSHPHLDHFGGFNYLAKHFKIGEFWFNGDIPDNERFRKLLETMREKETPIFLLSDKSPRRELASGVSVEVFNHKRRLKDGQFTNGNVNNNSLVLRICYVKQCMLFAGDIQKRAELYLANEKRDISAEILKIPHHGSKTSSTPPFLFAVSPKEGILMTRGVSHRHFPHKSVLQRYEERSIKILCPDVSGAITYTFSITGKYKRENFLR
ncbi:MAG: hypothetical protein Kow0090_17610 [Myxococcota bacterium]